MSRDRRRIILPLLAASPTLALVLWWALDDGGYDPRDWLPGTLLVLAQVAVAGVGLRDRLRVPSRVALAALVAFCVWSFLSILWADAPGVAYEGSLRACLYAAVFGLLAALPWTRVSTFGALAAFVGVVTAAGVVALLHATTGADAAASFADARLADPLRYQNANAALWTMAAFPALALACRPEAPAVLRPPLLAASAFLLGLALMSVSRGWLFTLPVVALATLVLAPGRLRLALFALPVGAAVLAAREALVEPFRVGGGRVPGEAAAEVAAAADDAARALVLVAVLVLAAGIALVLADRRVRPSERTRRVAGRGALAAAVVVVVAGVGAGMVAVDGDPAGRLDRAWQEFKQFEQLPQPGEDRFSALGSTRYDFWRVATEAWADHPVAGLGQDNYAQTYVRERRTPLEEPRWTHSLPLRLLAHTGLVGLLLFAVFVVAAFVAALRRRAPDDDARRFLAGAAVLPAVVWLAHGAVDWLWEYPLLSVAAVGLLGIAGALGRRAPSHGRAEEPLAGPARVSRARRALAVVPAVLGVVLALLVLTSWMAIRDIDAAVAQWRADAPAAYQRLDRARVLNPLQTRASLVEGVVALQLRDRRRAESAFARMARREPQAWLPRFQAGILRSAAGDPARARAAFRAARARNPLDDVVAEALRRASTNRPLTYSQALRAFSERSSRRFGD